MKKPREFWIAEQGKYESTAWGFPAVTVRNCLDRDMGVSTIHVREVCPEYEEAVKGLVIEVNRAIYDQDTSGLFEALEAWRKVNET